MLTPEGINRNKYSSHGFKWNGYVFRIQLVGQTQYGSKLEYKNNTVHQMLKDMQEKTSGYIIYTLIPENTDNG